KIVFSYLTPIARIEPLHVISEAVLDPVQGHAHLPPVQQCFPQIVIFFQDIGHRRGGATAEEILLSVRRMPEEPLSLSAGRRYAGKEPAAVGCPVERTTRSRLILQRYPNGVQELGSASGQNQAGAIPVLFREERSRFPTITGNLGGRRRQTGVRATHVTRVGISAYNPADVRCKLTDNIGDR